MYQEWLLVRLVRATFFLHLIQVSFSMHSLAADALSSMRYGVSIVRRMRSHQNASLQASNEVELPEVFPFLFQPLLNGSLSERAQAAVALSTF